MGKKRSYKKERIQERILHDVNSYIRSSLRDSRLKQVTITKVEIAPDYSWAKIYWDTYDTQNRDEIKKGILNCRGKIRTMLASSLNIRHVPELFFIYDDQFESEKSIEDILNSEVKAGRYIGDGSK